MQGGARPVRENAEREDGDRVEAGRRQGDGAEQAGAEEADGEADDGATRQLAEGEDGQQAGVLEHGGLQRVDDPHGATACRRDEPRDAQHRVGTQVEWVAPRGVHAAQHDVDRLETAGGAQPQPPRPDQSGAQHQPPAQEEPPQHAEPDERHEQPEPAGPVPTAPGVLDTAAMRRQWPEILEAVKSISRQTWSGLQTAQLLDFDGRRILLGKPDRWWVDKFMGTRHEETLKLGYAGVCKSAGACAYGISEAFTSSWMGRIWA